MQTLFFGASMGCTKKHQTWGVLIYIFTPKIISERLIGTTHHPCCKLMILKSCIINTTGAVRLPTYISLSKLPQPAPIWPSSTVSRTSIEHQ